LYKFNLIYQVPALNISQLRHSHNCTRAFGVLFRLTVDSLALNRTNCRCNHTILFSM